MSNKKQVKKYEKKLSDLLDKCEFYIDSNTNKEFTPRKDFEDDFKLLITTPEKYFNRVVDEIDTHTSTIEREIFSKHGSGAKGAYKLLEDIINTLNAGTLKIHTTISTPTQMLKKFSTEEKYKILNALLHYNESGYFIHNPNMLMKTFNVKFEDIAHSIVSTPSWTYGADGFIPELSLTVKQEKVIELFSKYPTFDLKFTKDILEDVSESEKEDLEQAMQDYADLYGDADDAVYEFFDTIITLKESVS